MFLLLTTALLLLTACSNIVGQSHTAWQVSPEFIWTFPGGCNANGGQGNPQYCEWQGVSGVVPPLDDPQWTPYTSTDTISFSGNSLLCYSYVCDHAHGAIRFFQTFVYLPAGFAITSITFSADAVDDGVHMYVSNSAHPISATDPDSSTYAHFPSGFSSNIAQYFVTGETNRVVLGFLDDCCHEALTNFQLLVNGVTVPYTPPPNLVVTEQIPLVVAKNHGRQIGYITVDTTFDGTNGFLHYTVTITDPTYTFSYIHTWESINVPPGKLQGFQKFYSTTFTKTVTVAAGSLCPQGIVYVGLKVVGVRTNGFGFVAWALPGDAVVLTDRYGGGFYARTFTLC